MPNTFIINKMTTPLKLEYILSTFRISKWIHVFTGMTRILVEIRQNIIDYLAQSGITPDSTPNNGLPMK